MPEANARFVPEWLFRRYALLYKTLKLREFSMDDSKKILKEKEKLVYHTLSELTKAGWMVRRFHPSDARKRIYQLRDPGDIILDVIDSVE